MSDFSSPFEASIRQEQNATGSALVWDVPLRLFHWLLVVCVAVAAISGWLLPVNWLALHLMAGAGIAVLFVFRIIWGFTGSAFSRFSTFVFRPSAILAHVRALSRGEAPREPGHNPLGALMIIALAAALLTLLASGAITLGGVFKQGPFKSLVGFDTAWDIREIHEIAAFALLALIAGHLAGVVFESMRTRENLAASMVTGRKRGGWRAHGVLQPADGARTVIAAGVAALAAGGAYFVLTVQTPRGVPHFEVNAAWQKECGGCHIAFHPSLLPAASWSAIMAGLADHFGEDASLDEKTAAGIAAFLTANAAGNWDTLPAKRFAAIDLARPLEITATRFWLDMHRDIPAGVFTRSAVGAKQNCAACHEDAASGFFAPQAIAIPDGSKT